MYPLCRVAEFKTKCDNFLWLLPNWFAHRFMLENIQFDVTRLGVCCYTGAYVLDKKNILTNKRYLCTNVVVFSFKTSKLLKNF